ncbi:unnamed protein product [Toxocara canis]|uniref:Neur_chan_LBD domain-containing protein n=1 Tax=Toxocara canis TaxID=6265 RepID=A0A183U646_TOXCA|nr:unnamed protein product [Toxocara canis]
MNEWIRKGVNEWYQPNISIDRSKHRWPGEISLEMKIRMRARKVVIGSDDEYRLLQDLRKNYDPHERPVLNHSEPIVIKLRILLQQLVDVVSMQKFVKF